MYIKLFQGVMRTLDARAKHLRYWVEHLLTPIPFLSPGVSSSICLAKNFSLYRDSDPIRKKVLLLKTIKRSQDHTMMRQTGYTTFFFCFIESLSKGVHSRKLLDTWHFLSHSTEYWMDKNFQRMFRKLQHPRQNFLTTIYIWGCPSDQVTFKTTVQRSVLL